jgi:hypothetical protein
MIDIIFKNQINEAIFDSSVSSALENSRVLTEAFFSGARTNLGRKIASKMQKTKLPEYIKRNLENNAKKLEPLQFYYLLLLS